MRHQAAPHDKPPDPVVRIGPGSLNPQVPGHLQLSANISSRRRTSCSVRSSISTEQPPSVAPTSLKRLARVAGLLYLAVAITDGFAEGYLGPSLYVQGDATATAGNLAANPGLVCLGVVAHLADALFFVLTAVTLYGQPAARCTPCCSSRTASISTRGST